MEGQKIAGHCILLFFISATAALFNLQFISVLFGASILGVLYFERERIGTVYSRLSKVIAFVYFGVLLYCSTLN